jgi:CheY-like chemotaxis protein
MEERERVAERLRSLGELAAGVAHNFNNSLTSILAHAQLLARNPELSAEVLEDIRVIERVARGAAVTVRRIQSFARSRDPDAVELTDLNDVVANSVALTRPRWQPPDDANQWSFEWVHPDEPLPVVANAAELCEVVVNLILNGLDAMPEGGEMRVKTGAEGERVWVEVRDTGVGIDAESQRRLFDPFFSSKGRHGLGMGLSVSHGIVTRHGGEIDLRSAPGEGSRFTVRLPRGGKLDSAAAPGEAPPVKGRPGTILLVDDDAAVRRAIRQMLVDLGHTVIVAEQGKEALAKLDEHREVELLLSDLAMPVLDGARLLRECSRRWPELPRLLMTGLTADADAKSLELADALLRKPLEIDLVERTLARFLPAQE